MKPEASVAADDVAVAVPGFWRRLWHAQRREARRLLIELLQVRGLFALLMKNRKGDAWSADERSDVLRRLRRLSRLSPYLLLLLLPGSALFLPIYAWWIDRRRQQL